MNNKIYVITEEYIYAYEGGGTNIIKAFRNLRDAEKYLKKIGCKKEGNDYILYENETDYFLYSIKKIELK